MKKFKVIIPIIVIFLAVGLVIFTNTSSVTAANNECSADYTRENYINKIGYSISGNVVNYTGAKGLLYSTNFDTTRYPADANGNFSITIPEDKLEERLEVHFYLAESDGTCDANKEVGNNTVYMNASSRNQLYDNALCVNYRNKWSKNSTMKEAVSYCFEEETSVQYSYEEVSGWISRAESLYESQANAPTIDKDPATNVDNVKNTGKLTCDAFSNSNYETMRKFSHVESTTSDNCTTTCREDVEVNFSDPIATQAGMCFEYLIEIKSKVTCENRYTAPMPSLPTVCVPTAHCVSSNGFESDKGGPTEEFDACVNECDGGEYTQSCIDKCYTKVYEENETYTDKVNTQTAFEAKTDILTFNAMGGSASSQASKLANGCLTPATVSPYDDNQIRALYEQHQRDPGGKYVGNRWVPSNSGCSSSIAQFYFKSFEKTKLTVQEVHGLYVDQDGRKQYCEGTNGFLTRCMYQGYENWCTDTCNWINNCGSNTVLTPTQATEEYEKAMEEYEAAKAACEGKGSTCSNNTATYTITVDNLDSNDNKNDKDNSDWHKEFTSNQKMNSNKVTGKFPDMVTLVDGLCETGSSISGNNGNSQGGTWDYHNIITFPGIWINNKTGQTTNSVKPGYEDFYTYAGNEFCTKLNSIPVNTAWYYWKVNQNGDSSVLSDSDKNAITSSLDMNINGSIDNYGYFGWNFDVECFYALDKPNNDCDPSDPNYPNCDASCPPTDPDYPNCDSVETPPTDDGDNPPDETTVTNYKFRPITLDNLFPDTSVSNTSDDSKNIVASNLINEVESLRTNKSATLVADSATREPGFNWSCEATNLENEDYLIQPVTLKNTIERLGDSIYEDDSYVDYHIVLTPETMKKVRNYNKQFDSYTEPSNDNSSEVLVAGNSKTAGITVYRSYLLHRVLNKGTELVKSGVIGCNNETNGQCINTIDTSTSCYREYQAESAILKGAN